VVVPCRFFPLGQAVNQNIVGMQITHGNILKENSMNFKNNIERDGTIIILHPFKKNQKTMKKISFL
jgi:translation initiation factor IF-2